MKPQLNESSTFKHKVDVARKYSPRSIVDAVEGVHSHRPRAPSIGTLYPVEKLKPGRAGHLSQSAQLIANIAGGGPHNTSVTGYLPYFTPPVLDVAAIGSDQKNDHATRDAADRCTNPGARRPAGRANECANTGTQTGPEEHIALEI